MDPGAVLARPATFAVALALNAFAVARAVVGALLNDGAVLADEARVANALQHVGRGAMAGTVAGAVVRAAKERAIRTSVDFVASALTIGHANAVGVAHVGANLVAAVLTEEVVNACANTVQAVTMTRTLETFSNGGTSFLTAVQSSPAGAAFAASASANTLVLVGVAHGGADLLSADLTGSRVAPVGIANAGVVQATTVVAIGVANRGLAVGSKEVFMALADTSLEVAVTVAKAVARASLARAVDITKAFIA